MLRTHEGKLAFSQGNHFDFVTAFGVSKCRKQIKLKRSFPTGAPISELPSNISTIRSKYSRNFHRKPKTCNYILINACTVCPRSLVHFYK